MPLRRKPQMTSVDFLIGMAEDAAKQGQPFAEEFRDMAVAVAIGPDAILSVGEARRPLNAHEASPVSIILGAYEFARRHGDRESVDEVLRVGLSLLAKWPYFLLSRVDGHPDLELKATEEPS